MKKISVITPSFNSVKYIRRAIDSVLEQQYDNFEHIVVDGLSTDGTQEVLKNYPHVRWVSEADNGQSDAMNKGFALATGAIIVYLNADDYFLPGVFHKVHKTFERECVDIVFGSVDVSDLHGNIKRYVPSTNYEDMLEYWKTLYPVNPVQYFYKRELQEGILFNTKNYFAMDHEFLLTICKESKIKQLEASFGVFDMVEGSKTVEGTKKPETYWVPKNFSYIDQFLKSYPNKYIFEFKNKQIEFLASLCEKRINFLEIERDDLIADIKQLRKKCRKLRVGEIEKLLQTLSPYKKIIIYGAGEQTDSLFYPLYDKIEYIVDKNAKTIGALQDKTVKLPEALKKSVSPVVLVSAVGYNEEITTVIKAYNESAKIFFVEDFVDA
jgi:glycosyltransferase involved in cell wall biosynthesis